MSNALTQFIRNVVLRRRPPDQIIGGEKAPYMLRWWVVPRNKYLNVYYHEFRRSDDDRALHDHPWWNCSILLSGQYAEVAKGRVTLRKAWTRSGVTFRRPETPHRIALFPGRPAATLFITGPWRRSWGFHCPQGWRHWRDFVDPNNPTVRGPGCD